MSKRVLQVHFPFTSAIAAVVLLNATGLGCTTDPNNPMVIESLTASLLNLVNEFARQLLAAWLL